MTFYEISFPITPDWGTDGGPGFDTSILTMDSGQENATQRRSTAQHSFNAAALVRTASDIATLKAFYLRVGGVSGGFRYKDWTDYTSTDEGRTWGDDSPPAVAHTDQVLGTGDGTETEFQLVKVYGDTAPQYTRTIRKPVSGTVKVGLDSVNQGSGWTVNTSTGVVTFSAAPGAGVQVSAGFEFDVPVRFGVELDRVLAATVSSFGSSGVRQVPLVELLEPDDLNDAFHYGGAYDATLNANSTLSVANGRVQSFNVNAGSLKATLPDFTNLPTGGPYFVLIETGGANSLAIHDQATDTLQFTLAASGTRTIYLGLDSGGAKKWYAA